MRHRDIKVPARLCSNASQIFVFPKPRLGSSVVLLLATAFFGQQAGARPASRDESPEVVISFGVNQDDAVQKGLRQAVSQKCGENLKARRIERNSFSRSTSIDDESGVSGSQDSDINTKNELAATTGGIIRRWRQLELNQEAPNRFRVVVEVYIEKCTVEGSGRIAINNGTPPKNQKGRDQKVDPKSFVERETVVTVRYEVPPVQVDNYALKSLMLSTAQGFALNVVKAEVLPGSKAQPVSSRVEVLEVRDLEPRQNEYGFELTAKVSLYGVRQEIDGNTMGDGSWGDVEKSLILKSGYSSQGGFLFYMNESSNAAIIYDVDRRGASFGKVLRGDIVEMVNGVKMSSVKEFPMLLNNALVSGPASLFVRRGSATHVVVIR
jgi:hypothetical protein